MRLILIPYASLLIPLAACGGPAAPPPLPAKASPSPTASVPVAESIACPSFEALGRQVDERVKAIEPGVTLEEFTTTGPARFALNFWDDVPGDLRETVFFVPVSDGNSLVLDQVVCRFDKRDILVSCTRECCRHESRTITPEQYESLRVGESRKAIESRLCTPSYSEREGPSRVKTYYHIDLPVDHHDEGQTVLLVFDDNKLSSKDMNPYY